MKCKNACSNIQKLKLSLLLINGKGRQAFLSLIGYKLELIGI